MDAMTPNLTQPQFRKILSALDAAINVTDSANPRNRESFRLMHRLLRLKLRVLVLRDRVDQRLAIWVEERPENEERIEAKIRNVPEQNRERAFINAAKTESMNQKVRRNGNGVRV